MIGFLSKVDETSKKKVKHDEIYFIHFPDGASADTVKMLASSKAKLFADKFNVNKVFLYIGKEKYAFNYGN